jgi:hypothetical protein
VCLFLCAPDLHLDKQTVLRRAGRGVFQRQNETTHCSGLGANGTVPLYLIDNEQSSLRFFSCRGQAFSPFDACVEKLTVCIIAKLQVRSLVLNQPRKNELSPISLETQFSSHVVLSQDCDRDRTGSCHDSAITTRNVEKTNSRKRGFAV